MNAPLQVWNLAAAVVWFGFLSRRLRHISDKRQEHVLGAFVAAGILSVGLALMFYEIYPRGLDYAFSRWEITYHVLVVGVVEETAKFFAFLFAVRAGSTIKEPHDGVIQAAMVGIVFGTIENVGYIQTYGTVFIAVRPVITTGGHALWAAICGGLYARWAYARTLGYDPGARTGAVLGIPLVALFHGTYNAATIFLPAALLVDGIALLLGIGLFRNLVELSPYRVYPLGQAKRAVESLRRGLALNPRSPVLNRNMGLYLMHLGRYKAASGHLRASVPRSRDPRRAQFLAAACEQTFLPAHYARRALRIAWARLTDAQRTAYLEQLDVLVADRDGIRAAVNQFIAGAFRPRRVRNSRDVAHAAKVRRANRRYAARAG